MRLPVALLLLVSAGFPQDAKPTEKKKEPVTVKVLKAIVIDVSGKAQARVKPGDKKWSKLKVNDVLEAGALVRTGRKSSVTLRIGKNATLLIERQSRVAIPEIAQAGQVLRTRVSIKFGKADVKVDRIGLVNDFEVSTPTATLAVRGTVFRIWWDAVWGFRSMGIRGNKIRAIEIRYVNGVKAYLSGAQTSSKNYKLPALAAFFNTYLAPLQGAVSPGKFAAPGQSLTGTTNPTKSSGLKGSNARRSTKTSITRNLSE